MLKINNLGVSILYVDAFFVTHVLHRTKHELIWFSGFVGSEVQIEFTQTLHRHLVGEEDVVAESACRYHNLKGKLIQ